MAEEETKCGSSEQEYGWRVPASILVVFALVIAVLLWLFFFAGSYNIYQNIAVFVVIFLAFIASMGAAWAGWGMKFAESRRASGLFQ